MSENERGRVKFVSQCMYVCEVFKKVWYTCYSREEKTYQTKKRPGRSVQFSSVSQAGRQAGRQTGE